MEGGAQAILVGGQTMAHPIGLLVLILCLLGMVFKGKQWVVPSLLIFVFAIPSAQRVVILGLDFSFLRIIVFFSICGAYLGGLTRGFSYQKPDKVIIAWAIWALIAYGFLLGSFNAVVTRAGFMVDAVGTYFVGRLYIKSWKDLKRVVLFVGYASFPVMVFFLVERATGKNLFYIFGGIDQYTLVREGKLRCQGPFSHPIMAGLFWASILPWLALVWIRREASKIMLIGMIAAVVTITLNTVSSTPVMAILLIVVGLALFPFRRILPGLRWVAVFGLVVAQIVMEKGAAHLIARVNVFAGSTGWHRYHLIDEAINHLGEWFWVGTLSTEHWGLGLGDVTNQYILEAVRGGLLGMVLFIMFLVASFNLIGRAIKLSSSESDRWVPWMGGVVFFVHSFSFLSVSYFGQVVASFFLFSGIIVSIAAENIFRLTKSSEVISR
jgi:hypothetical protein